MHATGRKIWAEWANELGCKRPGGVEGKLVSFLYTGESRSQTVWGCRMYLNLLRDGRKGKGGKRECSGDKLLSCFLLSLLPFSFCLYKQKGNQKLLVSMLTSTPAQFFCHCTCILPLSLSFSFFLDFIVVMMEKKDLQRFLKCSMNFSGRAVTSAWLSLDWAQLGA